jgi:hypothetical protein
MNCGELEFLTFELPKIIRKQICKTDIPIEIFPLYDEYSEIEDKIIDFPIIDSKNCEVVNQGNHELPIVNFINNSTLDPVIKLADDCKRWNYFEKLKQELCMEYFLRIKQRGMWKYVDKNILFKLFNLIKRKLADEMQAEGISMKKIKKDYVHYVIMKNNAFEALDLYIYQYLNESDPVIPLYYEGLECCITKEEIIEFLYEEGIGNFITRYD